MTQKKLHLICNAHIDPIWRWGWEEGAAETISTFRVAAEFCEAQNGFIFNHNESILYKWIEEFEPDLFEKIRVLVKKGQWHIMGGWYVQPDCNMPSGESFIRQILEGKRYFKEKFGVEPTTAINFDPFGHSRGLVQILKKSGFDSYLFCRPLKELYDLPSEDFIWVGFDGSEILTHRGFQKYQSVYGRGREKVEAWLAENREKKVGALLWGIGNHGGGPSRIDLENIQALITECEEFEILHSTPENYFEEIKNEIDVLPRYYKDINPWAVGCYTTQIRIKQMHRQLENDLFMAEKMITAACLQKRLEYPEEELREALEALLLAQFHDILPGTTIQPEEENSLHLLGHGLILASKIKAKAFFALADGQKKAESGELPIMVYNPHPYPIEGLVECGFQLPHECNRPSMDYIPIIHDNDGKRLPLQLERGHNQQGDISIESGKGDRKQIAFWARLEASSMNRFDCKIEATERKKREVLLSHEDRFIFSTSRLQIEINTQTGLVDRFEVDGKPYLKPNSFCPLVISDNDHSIGTWIDEFPNQEGAFSLMEKEAGTCFSGVHGRLLESVRVIEDGEVRTVIEAVFSYGKSDLCMQYFLPKIGTEVQIQVRVHWNEKSKMLKLAVPTVFDSPEYLGQTAFGAQSLPTDGKEAVSQKWVCAADSSANCAVSIVNDSIYGSSSRDGEIRLTLLRSPRYGCLYKPHMQGELNLYNDRYIPRVDQGERIFNFWLKAGSWTERKEEIEREAVIHNEKPYVLSFYPSGEGQASLPAVIIDDPHIQMPAFKRAEDGKNYILRLYEPTGNRRTSKIRLPSLGMEAPVELGAYEVKTLCLHPEAKILVEVDMMEKPV